MGILRPHRSEGTQRLFWVCSLQYSIRSCFLWGLVLPFEKDTGYAGKATRCQNRTLQRRKTRSQNLTFYDALYLWNDLLIVIHMSAFHANFCTVTNFLSSFCFRLLCPYLKIYIYVCIHYKLVELQDKWPWTVWVYILRPLYTPLIHKLYHTCYPWFKSRPLLHNFDFCCLSTSTELKIKMTVISFLCRARSFLTFVFSFKKNWTVRPILREDSGCCWCEDRFRCTEYDLPLEANDSRTLKEMLRATDQLLPMLHIIAMNHRSIFCVCMSRSLILDYCKRWLYLIPSTGHIERSEQAHFRAAVSTLCWYIAVSTIFMLNIQIGQCEQYRCANITHSFDSTRVTYLVTAGRRHEVSLRCTSNPDGSRT